MTIVHAPGSRLDFELPTALEAAEPPEVSGRRRDSVRLLVTSTASGVHVPSTFDRLGEHLEAGDLLVINTSGTIPAAIDATAGDDRLVVHLSTELDDGRWVVEPRRIVRGTTERWAGPLPPRTLRLGRAASMTLDEPYGSGTRLWAATLHLPQDVRSWLATHGRPIQYSYTHRSWPIEAYQNVYATEPGSAEMPSAGRPFTLELIASLVAKGVRIAPVVLHTGVSSLEADETPYPERVRVPVATAELVTSTKSEGHRVVAVGSTVVRALESAADRDGAVHAFEGWTELVITPDRGLGAVDGMVTGWHEPVSSHLLMLEALMGRETLEESYAAALGLGFRWHEFGDSHLILT